MKLSKFWLLMAALLAVRLVLMVITPVFEPSEARYAALSANMARSGDFVVPHFTYDLEYQSFDGKPPLVFQVGGLFCRALGMDAPWKLQFAVRLFPLLSALLLLGILYHTIRRLADVDTGRLAVLVCATSTAFFLSAGIAMTDMSLACSIAGALLCYRLYLLDGFAVRHALAVGALLGMGMLVKGPVALVMFGLPVLADAICNRRWKGILNWRWIVVLPLFLAIAVPWFVLVEMRNPGSVWYFFYNENFMRFISHDYGDKYGAGREAFRGVSVIWAFVSTLPWALLPAWELFKAVRRDGFSALRVSRLGFFAISIIAIIGFWCLTSRVLIYYLFPVIPLFAAWVVLRFQGLKLWRLATPCAVMSMIIAICVYVIGMEFSDKMLGDRTEFSPMCNHYAYEFYHGRLPDAKLKEYRERRDQYIRWRRENKKSGKERAK